MIFVSEYYANFLERHVPIRNQESDRWHELSSHVALKPDCARQDAPGDQRRLGVLLGAGLSLSAEWKCCSKNGSNANHTILKHAGTSRIRPLIIHSLLQDVGQRQILGSSNLRRSGDVDQYLP